MSKSKQDFSPTKLKLKKLYNYSPRNQSKQLNFGYGPIRGKTFIPNQPIINEPNIQSEYTNFLNVSTNLVEILYPAITCMNIQNFNKFIESYNNFSFKLIDSYKNLDDYYNDTNNKLIEYRDFKFDKIFEYLKVNNLFKNFIISNYNNKNVRSFLTIIRRELLDTISDKYYITPELKQYISDIKNSNYDKL